MKLQQVISNGSPRLVLIFSGWASNELFYTDVTVPDGYDLAIAYDYRQPATEGQTEAIAAYQEICVIAWSFGVPVATRFINENPQINFTLRVAVNGTVNPVDDNAGIPRAIFHGTLANLDTRNLTKFMRRTAGSAAAAAKLPQPETFDIEALKAELESIASLPPANHTDIYIWDRVVISSGDAIIPTANQLHAWSGHNAIIRTEGSHLPDFAGLIRKLICDKSLVTRRFEECASTYQANAEVQRGIALNLYNLWNSCKTGDCLPVLEIGAGTGFLTSFIGQQTDSRDLELWDLTPLPESLPGRKVRCDAEIAIDHVPPASFGSILSASTMQWFNSPATFLRHAARALKPGGTLALSTFAPDNFSEINRFLPNTPNYLSAGELRAIIPGQLDILVLKNEKITVSFNSSIEMLRHIKLTGVNAMHNSDTRAARAIIASGIIALTYSPIYLIARKK